MSQTLQEALQEFVEQFSDIDSLVRVVLSGRRRNMQTQSERIDIRPVAIKDQIQLQVSQSDGRQMTTKNFTPGSYDLMTVVQSGYANLLIEYLTGSLSIRITKKGEALVHRAQGTFERELAHDRSKARLLDATDPFLKEVGISDGKGAIKPSMQDKYRQVEEFLRILIPTLTAAINAGHIHKPTDLEPLIITDLGCGHAYLTFAAHQYLWGQAIPVKVIGIDVRETSRDRNNEIAKRLGITSTMEFRSEEIVDTPIAYTDVAIALHACDTATDDAIAWAIHSDAKIGLFAPCCHHDIQAQMNESPPPWELLTRYGIMKERLGDLLTDALRMQIMKLRGYRVEAIEFIGGEHTPRNLMIRAVKTGSVPAKSEVDRYEEMVELWKVKPALASLLNH